MSKVEELLEKYNPDGVPDKLLVECSLIDYGYPFTSSMFTDDSSYIPIIRIRDVKPGKASTYYMGNYSKEYIVKRGDILVGMDGEFNLEKWNDIDSLLNQRVARITEMPSKSTKGYLYHILGPIFKKIEREISGGSVKHLSVKIINSISIPLPHIKVQEEIVKILDSFTNLIDALNEELSLRQKQFEYYREKLLTFDKCECEWKKLGDIAEIGTGRGNTNEGLNDGLYPFFTRGQDILWKNDYEFDEEAVITAGDGVGVGKVMHYINGKYSLHQRAYRFKPTKKLVTKFLYHYMKVTFFKYVCGNSVASSVSSLRKPQLIAYPIPIPSLAIQKSIVEKLDAFESLISSLKEEIALRQKQYEYYREKLLTFD